MALPSSELTRQRPAPPSLSPEESTVAGLPFRGARAILVAVLLTPLCTYFAGEAQQDVILSLMVPPVSCLILLLLLNPLWRLLHRRLALTSGELIIIYGMLQTATAIAAEWLWVINPLIGSYAAFQERASRFTELMLPYVPDQLHIKDPALLGDYITGGVPLRDIPAHLSIWWGPVFWWTLVVGVVLFAMLCINGLMRQEWTDREKLSFPIIQLPLAMAAGGPTFWRSRYMWGAAISIGLIDVWNGFAFLYPTLPLVRVRFLGDLNNTFPDYPFNAIGWTPIGIFPFIVGLGLFLPTDLLFSVIFFFFLRKTQQIVAASMGYPQGVFGGGGLVPSPPYFSEQSWGAFLGLFVSAMWVARPYLREVWHDILAGTRCPDGGVSRRWLFIMMIASILGMGWLGVHLGLPFFFVVLYVSLFLAFSVALTRMRAQLGPPTHEMAFMGPNQLLVDFHGTQGVPAPLIARTVSMFHFMNRIHRTHPMPAQLELMKMGERTQMPQKTIFFSVILAVIAGCIFGHLSRTTQAYIWGAPFRGTDVANVVNELVTRPRNPNTAGMIAVGLGFAVVMGLDFIRFRAPWFPFHPMGYALAMNFGVDYYWFGLILALTVKLFVQKYIGLKGYAKLHHAALGLILGEFAVETVWMTWAVVNRYATYTISINGRLGWQQ